MELGIGPTVTAGLIIQLLVGSKILDVDTNVKSDRDMMKGAEHVLGLLITVGQVRVLQVPCMRALELSCMLVFVCLPLHRWPATSMRPA